MMFMGGTFVASICARNCRCQFCMDIRECPFIRKSEKYQYRSFAANNNSQPEIAVRIDGTKLKCGCFERFFGVRS